MFAKLNKKLKEGIKVADIGCGRGKDIIKLAKAFPNSKFYGYDIHKRINRKSNTQCKKWKFR